MSIGFALNSLSRLSISRSRIHRVMLSTNDTDHKIFKEQLVKFAKYCLNGFEDLNKSNNFRPIDKIGRLQYLEKIKIQINPETDKNISSSKNKSDSNSTISTNQSDSNVSIMLATSYYYYYQRRASSVC